MSSTVAVPRPKTKERSEEPPKWMKAIIRSRFGFNSLQLEQVATQVPKEGQVLVKVEASSVNAADRHSAHGPPFALRLLLPLFGLNMGVRKPKDTMLGTDLAGTIMALGPNATRFQVGDEVFGASARGSGSYSEYALAREDKLVVKPANVPFEQAGAVGIAALTALQALRNQGNIKPGEKVLVNGAGGGVGTFTVQIAKALGAEVTAVTNTEKMELMKQLGADHVIDYTKEDFAKRADHYDLIVDIAATHSFRTYKRLLNPNGRMVLVGMKKLARLPYYMLLRPILGRGNKKFKFFVAKINDQDLAFLSNLMEQGKLVSVIDTNYPLTQTLEAFHHFEKGGTRGKIIITPGRN